MMRTEDKTKEIENLVKRLEDSAHYLARKRFYEDRFDNPYKGGKRADWVLVAILRARFEGEMQYLLNKRVCPSCGQYTMGDIDW